MHIADDSMLTSYTTQGKVGGLEHQERWMKEEMAIRQVIGTSVPSAAFTRIKGQKTVKGTWAALKRLYEEKMRGLSTDLMRRFRNTKCGENDSVRTHFKQMANVREQLAAMGKVISDEDYTDILLTSLPSSYDQSCTSISHSTRLSWQPLTADALVEMILNEFTQREIKKEKSNSKDEAFAADTTKPKKQCSNCKKRGHLKADCWAKGGGKEGQGPRSKDKGKDSMAAAEDKDVEAWTLVDEEPAEEDDTAWIVIEEAEADEDTEIVATAGGSPAQPGRVHDTATELYDSGASRHMSPFCERFLTYQLIKPRPIVGADKSVFYTVGTGDLRIEVPHGESSTPIILQDALHAPNIALTIVSIDRICKAGNSVTFKGDNCTIKNRNDKTIGVIPVSANGLYKVEHAYAATIAPERVDLPTLHRRLCHIVPDAIRTLINKGAAEGVQLIDDRAPLLCDSCKHAKSTCKPISKERTMPLADAFGAEVHTDLWGPSPLQSLGGRKYYVAFTDDATRYTTLTVLRSKDEALDAYKAYAAWAHTQHGVRIKRLHSDRGGEYTGKEFTKFLNQQGTERRLTTHDTPQHNGVTESLNRHLVKRVRTLLHSAGLPKTLWAEALHFVVWVKNRTLTRVLGNVTPFEKLTGNKPNISGVPEWGQRVWVHTAANSKLDAHAATAHWVGYDGDSTHAHRIYWAEKRKVSVERDVKFMPNTTTVTLSPPILTSPSAPAPVPTQATPPKPPVSTQNPSPLVQTTAARPQPPPATDSGEEEVEVEDELDDLTPPPPSPRAPQASGTTRKGKSTQVTQPTHRSSRIRAQHAKRQVDGTGDGVVHGPPGSHPDYADAASLTGLLPDLDSPDADAAFHVDIEEAAAAAVQAAGGDPKSLREAQTRSDWRSWKEAMDRELSTLQQAGTWETVPCPTDKNVVDCKWVYRTKYSANGTIDKHKARLVARGFTQIYGVNYLETYSPVAKLASLRTILVLAARLDWDIECFDFNAAYLNGELKESEEIYMEQPPGYAEGGAGYVKRLKKALYGLKQAGH
jgi:hypothetical protein